MSKTANLATQERFGKAVNTNNLSEMRHLVAPDCIDHDPAPNQARGPEGYISMFGELIAAFPDLAVGVEHMVADEDNI